VYQPPVCFVIGFVDESRELAARHGKSPDRDGFADRHLVLRALGALFPALAPGLALGRSHREVTAGITIISGHSGQSLKVSFGFKRRCSEAICVSTQRQQARRRHAGF
jgi:hypothetical protein